jgi:hypothetical protein
MKNKKFNYKTPGKITTTKSFIGGSISGASIVFLAKTYVTNNDFKTTIIYFSATISSIFTYYLAPYIRMKIIILSQNRKISKLKKERTKLTTVNAIKDCEEAIAKNESWLVGIISDGHNINQ